jgi:serine/threonine protein phosphatase PrpC
MKKYKKYIKPYKVKERVPGETSYIIEEMMDRGIAKGDITQSDGIGTDNMTCIIVQFIDESQQQNKEIEAGNQEHVEPFSFA